MTTRATRERAGPEEFLEEYRGYLQADAYGGYDAFFKDPARGLIEVGCWAHARRYFHKALESDQPRMGPALLLIAQLYRVEKHGATAAGERPLARAPTTIASQSWISCVTTYRRSRRKSCRRVRQGERCGTR